MKILYLNPSAQLGGAEQSLLDLLAALREARPDWEMKLLLNADGPLAARARKLGVEAEILPLPASLSRLGDSAIARDSAYKPAKIAKDLVLTIPQAAAYSAKLRRAIHQFTPDLVQTNGLKMHILAAWGCPGAIPLVWHIRDYVSSRPVMRHLIRIHSRRCRAAISNSDDVAADLRSTCRNGLEIVRVYNAIDTKIFCPDGARLDLDALARLAPASAATIRVGLVATMARWKGHEMFLRAISRIPAQVPLRGYIIGGPIYQTEGSQHSIEDLRKLAAQLGLAGRVGFTGFVDDAAGAIRALDIVVHASTAPEPFGRVIAEAMACGKPVVISRSGGAVELIKDGEDALSYPPGDAGALADHIQRLAANADLRDRLGRSARRAAENRFAGAQTAREIISVYESAIIPRRRSLL